MEQKKITEHFTLNEMTQSSALLAYNKKHKTNYENLPTRTGIDMNLHHLCMQLETIRAWMNVPLKISSGYRSKLVNELVGGSPTSLHCQGLAADVVLPLDKICLFVDLAMGMDFTKEVLISHNTQSGSTWVHYGCSSTLKDQCRVGIDVNGKILSCVHNK
jgi:hypothetical protein